LGQAGEVECGLVVGAGIEFFDEVDEVAAGVAGGKAAPEIFGAADDEGVWIVAFVQGAGPDERIAALFEGADEAMGEQDLLEGDSAFKALKIEGEL